MEVGLDAACAWKKIDLGVLFHFFDFTLAIQALGYIWNMQNPDPFLYSFFH